MADVQARRPCWLCGLRWIGESPFTNRCADYWNCGYRVVNADVQAGRPPSFTLLPPLYEYRKEAGFLPNPTGYALLDASYRLEVRTNG